MSKIRMAIIVLAFLAVPQVSSAYSLKSLEAPVPVISGSRITLDDVQHGMDFHASLSEPLQYKSMQIPEGTEFIGHIYRPHPERTQVHGSLQIWIHEVIFPNGTRYEIYPNEQRYPHLTLSTRPRTLSGGALVDAGQKVYFQFVPFSLKGMFITSQISESISPPVLDDPEAE